MTEENKPLVPSSDSEGQPKVDVSWNIPNIVLAITAILLAIGSFAVFLIEAQKLPDQVPVHWGYYLNPNVYGSKYWLLFYPIIGAIQTGALLWLSTKPETFKYKYVRVNNTNCQSIYSSGRTLVLYVCCLINLLLIGGFLAISYFCINGVFPWLSVIVETVGFVGLLLAGIYVQDQYLKHYKESE